MRDDERTVVAGPGALAPTLDGVLDGLAVSETRARHGLHSPLYEALWGAHAALVPHLDPPRRPDWRHVAERLAARGVTDGKGAAPTGERVRKAWWKVGRDKARVAAGDVPRRRRGGGASPLASPGAVPRPVQVVPSPADRPDDDFPLTPIGGARKFKPGEC